MTGIVLPYLACFRLFSQPAFYSPQINQATHDQALVLQSALQNIPNPASECMLRNVAIRLAQQISDEVTENVSKRIEDFKMTEICELVFFFFTRILLVLVPSVIMASMGLLFSPEFFPGIKVHPRHLCDPSCSENSVGIRLRNSAARLQFKWRNQQDIWKGELPLNVAHFLCNIPLNIVTMF